MDEIDKLILVVDDEPDIGLLMEVILKSAGFRVRHAQDLESAKKEVTQYQFNTVFLDLNLNGQLGLDLLPEIEEKDEDTRVIVITAQRDPVLRKKVSEMGLEQIIEKPFTKKDILNALSTG